MRHLRARSRRLSGAAKAALALFLLAALALAWLCGGGEYAAERWLQAEGGRIGGLAPTPLLLLTRLGNLPLLAPIAIVLAAAIGRRDGWAVGLAYFASLALFRPLVSAVKLAVDRPRPHLTPHLDRFASGWSFPSAHSADSMAVLLGFALAWGGTGPLATALLLSGAIGVSRVLLGVHWPTDVIAGWSLGALWALGLQPILDWAARR